jgi:hypothetical protein
VPLFYFVLKVRQQSLADEQGQELPDVGAARSHAVAVAKELMRNREPGTHHWRIEVCDDYAMPLFEVLFATVNESVAQYPRDMRTSIKRVARTVAALNDAVVDTRRTLSDARETLARAQKILDALPRSVHP